MLDPVAESMGRISTNDRQINVTMSSWIYSTWSLGSGHYAIRIDVRDSDGNLLGTVYLDNFWLGGNDQIFLPDEIPEDWHR
jgi:hypothetical protein